MAPKGGKGGGGGSGSGSGRKGGGASCDNCMNPLLLTGTDWKDTTTNALFAIECIATIIIVLCMIFSLRFTLVKSDGNQDKLRNRYYRVAAGSIALAFILYIVDTALRETETQVTYLYYLLYIFAYFFWRLGELLILAIILRFNTENSVPGLWQKMHRPHAWLMLFVACLAITAFGFYTAYNAKIMDKGYAGDGDIVRDLGYVSVAYGALYLLAAILAGVEAFVVLMRERSKAAFIFGTVVIPCLFIRAIVVLVNVSVSYFSDDISFKGRANLNWAAGFIDTFMVMGIFVGVFLTGWLVSRKGRVSKHKEFNGPSYAPVHNTYG